MWKLLEVITELGTLGVGLTAIYRAARHARFFGSQPHGLARGFSWMLWADVAANGVTVTFGVLGLFDLIPEIGWVAESMLRNFVFITAILASRDMDRRIRETGLGGE